MLPVLHRARAIDGAATAADPGKVFGSAQRTATTMVQPRRGAGADMLAVTRFFSLILRTVLLPSPRTFLAYAGSCVEGGSVLRAAHNRL